MAIPTDYIFQSGTCLKKDVFTTMINALKAAGWTDISSKAVTDYIVLQSAGNTGDKNLLLNLRDVNSGAANSVLTTVYCQASYRLQDTYIPGASGAAGTFGRPSLAWTDLFIAPVGANYTMPMDVQVNYKLYCDASKIIMALEYPATTYGPLVLYLGEPDSVYVKESGSKGVLFATSANASAPSTFYICNQPDASGSVTAPYTLTTLSMTPSKNPNVDGKYFDSIVAYQGASEGIRGILDGVQSMADLNRLTGDSIVIDGKTYYVLACQVTGYSSFPTSTILVRTA